MSLSNISNCQKTRSTLGQRFESLQMEIKQKLDDLIRKEEVNQLWKLGIESTMHCVWAKVCTQRVTVSVSCQTDEQLEAHHVVSRESSCHINGIGPIISEEESCFKSNSEEDVARLHADVDVVQGSSSSVSESTLSTPIVSAAPHEQIVNKPRSRKKASSSRTHYKAQFSQNGELLMHERSHSESIKSSLQCQRCLQVFIRREHLTRHDVPCQKRMRKLPFECVICGRSYDTKGQLRNHSYYHKEKKHLCVVCGKAFTWLTQVNVHMVTHTGEHPYQCRFCKKRFTQRSNLDRHVRTQHH